MEQLRIGVIGTGRMGQAHLERLCTAATGCRVTAVSASRHGEETAAAFGVPLVLSPEALIDSPETDAVLVTSPGESHAAYVLACIERGKPVFCEKPLAPDSAACREILDAECAEGRRLVQTGFMRRFDSHHAELRKLLAKGGLGRALMVHATHRNPDNAGFTDELQIMDAAIHALDALPWLLGGDRITDCLALHGTSAACVSGCQRDPMLLLFRTASGVLMDLEVFTHCRYGYDIGCEIVCEKGTAALPPSSSVVVRECSARRAREYDIWHERYQHAFTAELQCFVRNARQGAAGGPSAWDGYAACAVGEACLRSLESGVWEAVDCGERPALYAE